MATWRFVWLHQEDAPPPPAFKLWQPWVCKANSRPSARPSFASQSSSLLWSLESRQMSTHPQQPWPEGLEYGWFHIPRTCHSHWRLTLSLESSSVWLSFSGLHPQVLGDPKSLHSLINLQWASGLLKGHTCFTESQARVPLWWLEALGVWLVPVVGWLAQLGREEPQSKLKHSDWPWICCLQPSACVWLQCMEVQWNECIYACGGEQW